ncbi:MAG: ankyrin repeat domain-containing protein [Candidatus Manganitrophus sp.]|nr:ankyrin repeat domain-containing protein [Candidatus Manganitrophus sp.]MDC4227772.1 ankyrin repeat domain-containing protein [Candidatus Manganitrophus sp.]WDT70867.1 MAG: ankyrin repeat domain-containing protein [Candidatus Manganitrophus sp.]
MLDAGAPVDARVFGGETPLIEATMARKINVVDLLIERGADVNARTLTEESPLFIAASGGDPETAALLLEGGPTFMRGGKRGRPP